jgi:MoxR-like ATPase
LSRIVDRTVQRDDQHVTAMVDRDTILELRAVCKNVLIAPHVQDFAIDLVMATQPGTPYAHEIANKYIRYGSSPRGAQALIECGRVLALMRGRLNLSIDDLRFLAPSILRHRIILNFDAHADGQTPETVLSRIISNVSTAAAVN